MEIYYHREIKHWVHYEKECNFYSIFVNYFPRHRLWTRKMKKPARDHSRPSSSLNSSTFSVTFISLNLLPLVLQSEKHLAFKHIQFSTLTCRSAEKAMAPNSSTLPWKIPWTQEPGRLRSMGSQRVGHDWATSLSLFTFMHWRRQWQPTPVFCWRIPGAGQPGGLPSVGSHRVGHDWSYLAEHSMQIRLLTNLPVSNSKPNRVLGPLEIQVPFHMQQWKNIKLDFYLTFYTKI